VRLGGTYIRVCTHEYMHTYVLHACMHTYIHIHTHTHTHTHIHIHTYIHTYTYMHIYKYTYMHICTHIHMLTYICTHTQATHIWAVQLNELAAKVVLHPDDEIAGLKVFCRFFFKKTLLCLFFSTPPFFLIYSCFLFPPFPSISFGSLTPLRSPNLLSLPLPLALSSSLYPPLDST
jgi:hypothetical protein